MAVDRRDPAIPRVARHQPRSGTATSGSPPRGRSDSSSFRHSRAQSGGNFQAGTSEGARLQRPSLRPDALSRSFRLPRRASRPRPGASPGTPAPRASPRSLERPQGSSAPGPRPAAPAAPRASAGTSGVPTFDILARRLQFVTPAHTGARYSAHVLEATSGILARDRAGRAPRTRYSASRPRSGGTRNGELPKRGPAPSGPPPRRSDAFAPGCARTGTTRDRSACTACDASGPCERPAGSSADGARDRRPSAVHSTARRDRNTQQGVTEPPMGRSLPSSGQAGTLDAWGRPDPARPVSPRGGSRPHARSAGARPGRDGRDTSTSVHPNSTSLERSRAPGGECSMTVERRRPERPDRSPRRSGRAPRRTAASRGRRRGTGIGGGAAAARTRPVTAALGPGGEACRRGRSGRTPVACQAVQARPTGLRSRVRPDSRTAPPRRARPGFAPRSCIESWA